MTEKECEILVKTFVTNVEDINLTLKNIDITLKRLIQFLSINQMTKPNQAD